MKKLLALIGLVVAITYIGSPEIAAQNKPKAKDLYTQYDEGSGTGGGSQGAKISVRLKRGNQPEKVVSVNETFYSGDWIKLVFDINFSGYAAILNVGTTGKETLLFPYLDANRQIVSHRISPNAGTQLPRGNDWIVFDENAGQEKVVVVFSKTPLFDEQATNSGGGGSSSGGGSNESSTGRIANESEADAILRELNSKNLIKRNSKDLYTQTENDGTYVVSPNGIGDEPVAFTFYLKHK
jgi:hypothetical protein